MIRAFYISCLILFVVCNAQSSNAETLTVEYSRFYSHVKKIEKEETAPLQFAFGFKKVNTQQLCSIESAKIITQKQIIDLAVTPEQRFVVPSEKALKLAQAAVEVELVEAANLCDMSVQLETKVEWLKSEYSRQELSRLYAAYQTFFDNMGGFLSFMMPSTKGLIMKMPDDFQVADKNALLKNKDGDLFLSESWLKQGSSLVLNEKPIRIIAKTE